MRQLVERLSTVENKVPARSLRRALVAVIVVVVCPQSTALGSPGYLAGSAAGRSCPEPSVVLEAVDRYFTEIHHWG